jgi:gliding motility-associated-like protein
MMKNIVLILVFVTMGKFAFAQLPTPPNCPPPIQNGSDYVQIFGIDSTSCNTPVMLSAIATSSYATTDSYIVQPIAYDPWPWVGANSIPSILMVDDTWSDSFNLSFPFCFYGNSFTKVIVSSNGSISFNLANTLGNNNWSTATWGPMPIPSLTSGTDFDNVICAPHYDILPSSPGSGKNITWGLYGTAPCRAFVISWDSLPMFSCTSLLGSEQIVLYENSNIIDINVKEKNSCGTWNSDIAYEGIQNFDGSKATVVPGRNGTIFTCDSSSHRFIPVGTGANGFTYTWYNAATGALVGTGNPIAVTPLVTTDYICWATSGCSGFVLKDTFRVTVTDPTIANFTTKNGLGCIDDTIHFTNTSAGAVNYAWSFGDGQNSIFTNPTHTYVNQNIYTITLIAINGQCRDTIKKVVNLKHPIKADCDFDSTICIDPTNPLLNGQINITNLSLAGNVISTFDFGDGTTVVKNNTTPLTHTYAVPGLYNFVLSVIDTLGCIDTFRRMVYVDGYPFAAFTVSDSTICLGQPVYFLDSTAAMATSFNWTFGDNFTIDDIHNVQHNYNNTGTYSVALTTKYKYCPNKVMSRVIQVSSYPTFDLGPDSTFCPDFTVPYQIPLAGNSAPSGCSYLWNTGAITGSVLVANADTYWLQATNTAGCATSDTVFIGEDCFINIPNAFTPGGGDKLNNYFMPKNNLISGALTYSMDVYNRWGERVFTTTNLNSRGWDGKFGEKDQPMGVYIYNINVTFKNGIKKSFTGNVTLLR